MAIDGCLRAVGVKYFNDRHMPFGGNEPVLGSEIKTLEFEIL
jgi:hypothetical protein